MRRSLLFFALFAITICEDDNITEIRATPPISSIPSLPSRPLFIKSNEHTNDRLHCPATEDAVSTCEYSNIIYFYECCGKLDMYCCMKFREWFWLAVVIAGGLGVIAFLGFCIRCVCTRVLARSNSYDF
ncbi:unnamed protein product, partial [Mesorhabditis spiculigera]